MGDKKKNKKTYMFIRLVSAAGTGCFYVKRKSSKKVAEKLEFRKYDPRVSAGRPKISPERKIMVGCSSEDTAFLEV